MSEWETVLAQLEGESNDVDFLALSTRLSIVHRHLSERKKVVQTQYHAARALLVVMGIVNPAMLTIMSDNCDNETMYLCLYWITWVSQMVAGMIVACMGMFSWDKKYYACVHYAQQLDATIWEHISARHSDPAAPSAQISTVLSNVERIHAQFQNSYYGILYATGGGDDGRQSVV